MITPILNMFSFPSLFYTNTVWLPLTFYIPLGPVERSNHGTIQINQPNTAHEPTLRATHRTRGNESRMGLVSLVSSRASRRKAQQGQRSQRDRSGDLHKSHGQQEDQAEARSRPPVLEAEALGDWTR